MFIILPLSTDSETPTVLSSLPKKSHHITERIIPYRSTPIMTHAIHILMTPKRRPNKAIHVNYPQTHIYAKIIHGKNVQAAKLELNITIQVLSPFYQGPR